MWPRTLKLFWAFGFLEVHSTFNELQLFNLLLPLCCTVFQCFSWTMFFFYCSDTSVLIRCTIASTTQASLISPAVDCFATEWRDCIELASRTQTRPRIHVQWSLRRPGILQPHTKELCNKMPLLHQPCKASALFYTVETTVAADCEVAFIPQTVSAR